MDFKEEISQVHSNYSVSPELDPKQMYIYRKLIEKNNDLAKFYFGALLVLKDEKNPDRFALASHGFRELMEKLPTYFNFPKLKTPPFLKNKVQELEKDWKKACLNQKNLKNISIDDKLRKFLIKVKEFFLLFNKISPERNKEIEKVFQISDPTKVELPKPITEFRVKIYDSIWDFFKKIAHHRGNTDHDDFLKKQNAMETLIVDIISPRTYDDFINIDSIITEGERK